MYNFLGIKSKNIATFLESFPEKLLCFDKKVDFKIFRYFCWSILFPHETMHLSIPRLEGAMA